MKTDLIKQSEGKITADVQLTITHHGGYHRKRQDPGWLSLGNSALTLTELPSEGCTAYLQIKSISFHLSIGPEKTKGKVFF